uniref:Uncharacterized protein n=1 Tax=Romanomermis culicivorax TaxID=13658 RepID=A0A915HYY9_ROMCU
MMGFLGVAVAVRSPASNRVHVNIPTRAQQEWSGLEVVPSSNGSAGFHSRARAVSQLVQQKCPGWKPIPWSNRKTLGVVGYSYVSDSHVVDSQLSKFPSERIPNWAIPNESSRT